MSDTRTLAFEIGSEEIPSFDLKNATEKFPQIMEHALQDAKIPFEDMDVFSTPRRLAVVVHGVAQMTEAVEETFKGPSVAIAFDPSGAPTKAAQGFARGKGVAVEDLEIHEENGVEYVYAHTSVAPVSVSTLLSPVLEGVIASIPWPKSMRWGVQSVLYSRPVRWLVALFGTEVIPVSFADVESGRHTEGHRVLSPSGADIPSAEDYEKTVRSLKIIPTQEERKEMICEEAARIAQDAGEGFEVVLPPHVLTEVVNLTEAPQALCARFDESFLKVPEEIIVDAMLMHQRYFPLYKDGKLTNRFVIVSNGDPAFADTIIDGNQRVVAARLYDAKFFYEEDLKLPLERYVERLDEVVFQERLGTMRQKTQRVTQLADCICLDAQLDDAVSGKVARAALLSKADLVTNAVIEFTSVQGVMGSYYAHAAGEDEEVASAIAEHYRPRFAGDDIPQSIVGRIVALADKIDTVCGLFAIGQVPTGSSDPFALRRAALGIIAILEAGTDISLEDAVRDALRIYQEEGISFNEAETQEAVMDFFITRTKVMLKDSGIPNDVVDAVLLAQVREPVTIIIRARALQALREQDPEDLEDLSVAYARANNLRDADAGLLYDASLFAEPEKKLACAIENARTSVSEALASDDYPAALSCLASLRTPIDGFFADVMVMDEDPTIRQNRMQLLNAFIAVFSGVADFGALSSAKR